jgi:hypothetical protein
MRCSHSLRDWPSRAPVRTGTYHDVWREKEHQKIVRGEWWKKEEKGWKQGWEITQMETWRGRQLNVHCWRRRADSIEENNITFLENNSNEEEAIRERKSDREEKDAENNLNLKERNVCYHLSSAKR